MKIKISDLKKSLAECHVTSDDDKQKFLDDVKDPTYFLQRTMEAIHECQDGIDIYENTRLAIQLLNRFRVFHRIQDEDHRLNFHADDHNLTGTLNG
jgi:hypothetical protein